MEHRQKIYIKHPTARWPHNSLGFNGYHRQLHEMELSLEVARLNVGTLWGWLGHGDKIFPSQLTDGIVSVDQILKKGGTVSIESDGPFVLIQ